MAGFDRFEKYRAVIFDFDYTLVDATKGIVACYNGAFSELGLKEREVEEIRRTVGLSVETSYTILTGDDDPANRAEFRLRFLKYAELHMTKNTAFLPGAMELLKKLREKTIKYGIVSNKRAARIKEFFEKTPDIMPDIVIGSDSSVAQKPDPEGINIVLRFFKDNFGIEKENTVYFGDTVVDAEAARAAGVDFFGVASGTTSEEELSPYAIGTAKDLIGLL